MIDGQSQAGFIDAVRCGIIYGIVKMNGIGLHFIQEKFFPKGFKAGIMMMMRIIKQGGGAKAAQKNKGCRPLFESENAFQENTFNRDLYKYMRG